MELLFLLLHNNEPFNVENKPGTAQQQAVRDRGNGAHAACGRLTRQARWCLILAVVVLCCAEGRTPTVSRTMGAALLFQISSSSRRRG